MTVVENLNRSIIIASLVLECVPANVAEAVTNAVDIPTIGIGAGNKTSGQVLVYHDMLGMLSHPHHEQFTPRFCKRFCDVGHSITKGLEDFKKEVEDGSFPSDEYSPYVMNKDEQKAFDELLTSDAQARIKRHKETAAKLKEADEYEFLSLYGKGGE